MRREREGRLELDERFVSVPRAFGLIAEDDVSAAPDGAVLADAGEAGDALIYADIDGRAYAASREVNPYLEDAARQGLI